MYTYIWTTKWLSFPGQSTTSPWLCQNRQFVSGLAAASSRAKGRFPNFGFFTLILFARKHLAAIQKPACILVPLRSNCKGRRPSSLQPSGTPYPYPRVRHIQITDLSVVYGIMAGCGNHSSVMLQIEVGLCPQQKRLMSTAQRIPVEGVQHVTQLVLGKPTCRFCQIVSHIFFFLSRHIDGERFTKKNVNKERQCIMHAQYATCFQEGGINV